MELLKGGNNTHSRDAVCGAPANAPRPAVALLCVTLAWFAVVGAVPCLSAEAQAPEYRVKAVFLLNFTRFIEWPSDALPAGASFHVCVLGDDPFKGMLQETFQGEVVQGHPVAIQHVEGVEEGRACQVLFISRAARDAVPAARQKLRGKPVLTVSEIDGFCADGGGIRLFVEGRHVRFDINPEACEQAGLRVSSRLLAVARIVRTARPARKGD